jgi:tRNA A-37 threonylcarbamoyl transferase component Bud32
MASNGTENRRVGRYELLGEIGRGGMAIVYRAMDTALKREVALKLLHPHLADHIEARKRFEREAHAVARLHHSSIVEVYDYADASADEVYIVMELVEGTTLRTFLDRRGGKPLLAEAAALMARHVFAALAIAHEQGVVHRDVKPENILIGADGALKLSDFGIAHLVGIDQMTVTGQILGSPAYMSPEHVEMAELDARADIFSLGTVMYEMAVGAMPFSGKNPHHIIKRIVEGYYDHPLSVNPGVGHGVASIIVRCMQRERDRRYASAAAVVADLDVVLAEMGIDPGAAELAAFFADPDAWEGKRRGPAAERTLALGHAARRAGRYPVAMDHYNRVLALEPGNERALDAVAGLSRRRQIRRFLERAALVLAVVVAALAIAWPIATILLEDAGGQAEGGDGSAGGKHGAKRASHSKAEGKGDAGPARGDRGVGPDGGVAAYTARSTHVIAKRYMQRPKVLRDVVFRPDPMRVEIVVDGTERFVFKTSDRSRQLPVGEHTVEFIPEDRRRESLRKKIEVTAGEGQFVVAERLKWRPARLKIASNVDAVVEVVNRALGRTNTFFDVPVEKGPQEHITVAVSAKGYLARAKQVIIAAGEDVEIPIDLLPAPTPAP